MAPSDQFRELELEREMQLRRARQDYFSFLCHILPSYQPAWFHRLIASRMQSVYDGDLTRLLITMGPRHGKSLHATVAFPAYVLGRNPDARIVVATYNNDFAKRINRDIQRLIASAKYREVFPLTQLNDKNVRTLTGQALRNVDIFETVGHAGYVKTTSIGAALTGLGADYLAIDDFCKNFQEATSPTIRERWWDWLNTVAMTRLQPGARAYGCATLWHHDDLFMRMMRQAREVPGSTQWERLNLPAIAEQDSADYDIRSPGEALWPERFPLEMLNRVRLESERTFISMYQQKPSADAGILIQKSWWQHYKELPESFDLLCMSADLNFHKTSDADYTVILVIGRKGPDFFIVDMVREQMGWLQQKRALKNLVARYPSVNNIYIEQAANGYALIEEAKLTLQGVLAVKPEGGKEVRLEAVSGLVEAGNVFLPHVHTGKFWGDVIAEELAQFPAGKNDDICDAFSMGISRMRKNQIDLSSLYGISLGREESPAWR